MFLRTFLQPLVHQKVRPKKPASSDPHFLLGCLFHLKLGWFFSKGVATSPGPLKAHLERLDSRQRFGQKNALPYFTPWGRLFFVKKNMLFWSQRNTTTTTTTTSTIIVLYFRQGSVVGITPFWQSSLLFKEDFHMSNGTTLAWILIWTSETRVLLSRCSSFYRPCKWWCAVRIDPRCSGSSHLTAAVSQRWPAAPWQPPQPKCACSSSLKLMTQVAMETVSVKIRVFHPNL